MNMTRRKFFRGVAIGLPAALVAAKLPADPLPFTSLADHTSIWDPYHTIRTGLPAVTWRQLYSKDFASVLGETNEIMADLKWREA